MYSRVYKNHRLNGALVDNLCNIPILCDTTSAYKISGMASSSILVSKGDELVMDTHADVDLARRGYKAELPRHLSMMSIFGLLELDPVKSRTLVLIE